MSKLIQALPGTDGRTSATVQQNLDAAITALGYDTMLTNEQRQAYVAALKAVPKALAALTTSEACAPDQGDVALVSRRELARLVGRKVSRQLAFQWVKRGYLDAVRIPGTRRILGFTRRSVMKLIQASV